MSALRRLKRSASGLSRCAHTCCLYLSLRPVARRVCGTSAGLLAGGKLDLGLVRLQMMQAAAVSMIMILFYELLFGMLSLAASPSS